MKYNVEVKGVVWDQYEIEADSEYQAEEKAKEEFEKDHGYGYDQLEYYVEDSFEEEE